MKAAGILFVTPDRRALFVKRGGDTDHPHEWCIPGGKLEDGETIEECAVRETEEEVGQCPEGPRAQLMRTFTPAESQPPPISGGEAGESTGGVAASPSSVDVEFTTFVQRVPEEFAVKLSDEHTGHAWASLDAPPEPLHPGVRTTLQRVQADELGVAKMIRDGLLQSPQRYDNVSLFAIRITGTGASYRSSLNEYVWRDSSIYLNQEFLERCNGLPVIWVHPKGSVLNSKEFANRVVGTVFIPFIPSPAFLAANPKARPDDVWAIVKIYDDEAITAMMDPEKDLSTSPSVAFRDPSVNQTMTLEDGSPLLIEGKPSLLDHIAIVDVGVWDKGEAPSGVINDSVGEKAMAEEHEDKLDKILAHCDSLSKRMDAMEAADKARKDAAHPTGEQEEGMMADRARKDGEEEHEEKADKHRKDGELPEALKEHEFKKKDSEHEEKEEKADKHRKDARRKDDDDDNEDLGGAEEGEAERTVADKKRKDDDTGGDRSMEETAKADAEIRDLKAQLADLQRRMPKQVSDKDYAAMADRQAKADSVYQVYGDAAPRPLQGEDLMAYRRRLAMDLKGRTEKFKDVNLHSVYDDAAFSTLEDLIYNDAYEMASSPAVIGRGEMIPMTRSDNGHTIREWKGDPSYWMNPLAGNVNKVNQFANVNGKFN